MRNVQLLEEQVANDKAKKMYSGMVCPMPEPEIVSCTPQDNLKRIDDLHHRLCETQRRLDSIESQLQVTQQAITEIRGIAAIFMVLTLILLVYLIWGTSWS